MKKLLIVVHFLDHHVFLKVLEFKKEDSIIADQELKDEMKSEIDDSDCQIDLEID